MPGFDKTGPMGQGPMTGRGFGPCGLGKKALADYKKALEEELEDVKKEEEEVNA